MTTVAQFWYKALIYRNQRNPPSNYCDYYYDNYYIKRFELAKLVLICHHLSGIGIDRPKQASFSALAPNVCTSIHPFLRDS